MADERDDRLDQTIDDLLAGRDATAALTDTELAPLAVLASELRHVPGTAFAARLRATLERRAIMTTTPTQEAGRDIEGIREGFTTVTPYLIVPRPGLVDFLVRVFGAEETHVTRTPHGGAHREVRVGDSMLMIGEGGPAADVALKPAAFHIYVPDCDAAYERALAAGAESLGAPADRPYGERAGFAKDEFGNHWYISTAFGPSYVPAGKRTITPFVYPSGAADYIDFLARAFGAEVMERHDSPQGLVMHARVSIGSGAIEMGDTQGERSMPATFYLYVADADALFAQAVAAGAKPLSPPEERFYGERVGSVEDSSGNVWYIARP
jgi:PhnB protein